MISRKNAYRSVVDYVASDIGLDLTEEQVNELVHRLMTRVKVDIVMMPEAVLPHAEALFPPENDEDYMQKQKQQRQTREQITKVVADFFNEDIWQKVSPFTIPAISGKGSDVAITSKMNHAAFFGIVNGMLARGELIRTDLLANIVVDLANRGALEKFPAPPVVVEPPPPPTPRELEQKRVKFERSLNNRETSPIRGAKERAKPLVPNNTLTEEQKAARNEKAAKDDETIQIAISRINTFTGASHSRTYSGRNALRAVFQSSMDEGLSAEQVLAAVEAEADLLAGNSSVR